MRLTTLIACISLSVSALGQTPPSSGKAEAKAEARASANASGSGDKSSSSQTVTHRVVVVNGKTIVDERKVNNKPVKSPNPIGRRGPRPGTDLESLQREMMRKLEQQMQKDIKVRAKTGRTDIDAKRRDMLDIMKSKVGKPATDSSTKGAKPSTKRALPKRGKLTPRTRKAPDTRRIR